LAYRFRRSNHNWSGPLLLDLSWEKARALMPTAHHTVSRKQKRQKEEESGSYNPLQEHATNDWKIPTKSPPPPHSTKPRTRPLAHGPCGRLRFKFQQLAWTTQKNFRGFSSYTTPKHVAGAYKVGSGRLTQPVSGSPCRGPLGQNTVLGRW
jgi:hypothetical protein